MKRIIFLALVLLLGFYVAWPAWNAYQISTAIKARDHATLEQKISFADVRESLKPFAVLKVGEVYDKQLQGSAGPTGAAILAQIKSDVVPKIVDTALMRLVTAPNLVSLVNDGRSLKESAERILQAEIGKIGLPGIGGGSRSGGSGVVLPGRLGQLAEKAGIPGFGAPKEGSAESAPAPTSASDQTEPVSTSSETRGFTLSNIKHFGILGPLAFEVGVAKDPAARQSDVIVEIRFEGADWRVVGVRPQA